MAAASPRGTRQSGTVASNETSLCVAASTGRLARLAASSQGSTSSRASAESMVRGNPLPSSPIGASRNSSKSARRGAVICASWHVPLGVSVRFRAYGGKPRDGGLLSTLRWNAGNRRGELRVGLPIDRLVPDSRARGILAEIVVVLEVPRRPHRSRSKSTAAIRADVPEHVLDTRDAERALIAADARLGGIRRQQHIAMLAGRP